MKALLKISALFAIGIGAYLGYRFISFLKFPASTHAKSVVIEVQRGETLSGMLSKLSAAGFKIDPLFRRLWIRKHEVERRLRIGEFEIQPKWSGARILRHMFFETPLTRTFTIKEGSNLYEIQALLKNKQVGGPIVEAEFQNWIHRPDLLKRMGVPEKLPASARSLEGFLFPETYAYFKSDTVETILGSMLTQFEERALPILQKHPLGNTPEGRFQLLTLASVVEKESGNVEEQPIVASVFWNRLKKKMRLESDPTIIYGLLPNFDGNIRRGDIRAPSLWNTYVIKTLPAGPISNPGLTALQAVVEPAETDYLFFVAKGSGGDHVFSQTYSEHSENVKKYQLRRASSQ